MAFQGMVQVLCFFVLSWDPTPRLGRLRHLPLQKNRQKTAEAQIIRALIIGIGFWGPFYYNCNKEPPKSYRQLFIEAPIIFCLAAAGPALSPAKAQGTKATRAKSRRAHLIFS